MTYRSETRLFQIIVKVISTEKQRIKVYNDRINVKDEMVTCYYIENIILPCP